MLDAKHPLSGGAASPSLAAREGDDTLAAGRPLPGVSGPDCAEARSALPLFGVRDLHTYYGDSHILHGVSLDLPEGKAVGLLGRNGMGKTTLIRTLMGYVRARSGQVLAQGRDTTGAAPEKMARLGIGYVPEGRGVFPNLSVRENLLMSARAGLDGQRQWTLERVLDTFPRLKERLSNGGNQLSGGEQQMVSIGRALMTNPRLMILDEATEGLAPLVVAEIWRVIAEIRQTGISTLIVDRDYKKVLAHTDHAVVMEKGRLALQSDSAALQARPEQLSALLGV
ncbi:ABC transporter ATP-binding protein [Comamonas phosphati]|nr:ABC transporter ATP-binding protein [Comamonas phosphati]